MDVQPVDHRDHSRRLLSNIRKMARWSSEPTWWIPPPPPTTKEEDNSGSVCGSWESAADSSVQMAARQTSNIWLLILAAGRRDFVKTSWPSILTPSSHRSQTLKYLRPVIIIIFFIGASKWLFYCLCHQCTIAFYFTFFFSELPVSQFPFYCLYRLIQKWAGAPLHLVYLTLCLVQKGVCCESEGVVKNHKKRIRMLQKRISKIAH